MCQLLLLFSSRHKEVASQHQTNTGALAGHGAAVLVHGLPFVALCRLLLSSPGTAVGVVSKQPTVTICANYLPFLAVSVQVAEALRACSHA
jgi:hypothetical protein